MRTNSSGRREIGVPKVSTEFLAAFAKADEIQFVMPGNTISVPVRGAGKAAAALEQCLVQKLPEWGIDPTTYLALRRPPVTVDGDVLIAGEEYPGVSIQNNEQGIVIARLGVDASGKVTSCAVLVSSNSSNLDRATCTIAVIRWKFHPAIGADGKPTAAPRVIGVEFRLEDSTRPDLFRGMFKD
jgi:TonB family protein